MFYVLRVVLMFVDASSSEFIRYLTARKKRRDPDVLRSTTVYVRFYNICLFV